MMITKEQQAQVDYNDSLVANLKSREQQYRIEEQEYDKILERRKEVEDKARERVKKQPRKIWINHLRKSLEVNDISPEIEERESEFIY